MPRGRPKRSKDIPCTCRACGKEYTVPEWQSYGRDYCSLDCYHKAQIGQPAHWNRREPGNQACPICGKSFETGGADRPKRTTVYCSLACLGRARATHAQARQMTETEVAWFAGVLDSEGTVNLLSKGINKTPHLRMSIANTCYPFLERVAELSGTGAIGVHRVFQPHHSPSWVWYCYGPNARSILRQVLPWLIVKRDKALLALETEATPPPD